MDQLALLVKKLFLQDSDNKETFSSPQASSSQSLQPQQKSSYGDSSQKSKTAEKRKKLTPQERLLKGLLNCEPSISQQNRQVPQGIKKCEQERQVSQGLKKCQKGSKLPEYIQIVKKSNVVKRLLNVLGVSNKLYQNPFLWHVPNLLIPPTALEYDKVLQKFKKGGKKVQHRKPKTNKQISYKLDVLTIERIINPYLRVQLELKKFQKVDTYGRCEELSLFHGTTSDKVTKICADNFNWRLTGTHVGHKFGEGMSFSPKATYASYYPKKQDLKEERTMILATVLHGRKIQGKTSMVVTPDGFDTSINATGDVIVKYEDADYNPEYLIRYKLVP